MLLSFIIPAYNEERSFATLLDKVLAVKLSNGFAKEIIIINDDSKDKTKEIAESYAKKYSEIKVLSNTTNMGKSQTVRKGILASTGDYVIIQDADLEYEPEEISSLLMKTVKENLDVVYGNRFGKSNKVIYWGNYIGNRSLSFFSNFFTYPRIGVWIPDMEVCYKLIRGDVARAIAKNIVSQSNFGFEPEVTAKLSKYKSNNKHLKFAIIPISYTPRSISEGKHMKALRDGFKALLEILRFNIF
jgi:glycosyltransferase involved in cell wall biosynthesis